MKINDTVILRRDPAIGTGTVIDVYIPRCIGEPTLYRVRWCHVTGIHKDSELEVVIPADAARG